MVETTSKTHIYNVIKTIFRAIAPAKIACGLIRLYQLCVSPFFPGCCRFIPSCSTYAITALKQHGFLKGSALTIKRLLKCHPWNEGNFDPVPPPSTEKVTPLIPRKCCHE